MIGKLFDEKLGLASTSEELGILKERFNKYDPLFVAVSTMTNRPEFRKWLEELWKQYGPYADTNFVSEFKRHFNQRSWEMYLGVTLLKNNHRLKHIGNAGPDLNLVSRNKNIWVEAIAVEKGNGQDRVPEIEYGKVIDVPEKEMMLRLTSGLKEKHQKYLSYLNNGIIKENDPFIIAINRSGLEHVDPQIPLIFKCLFGIGYQVLSLGKNDVQKQNQASNWSSRKKIQKVSGSNVETNLFGNSDFEGISAIIYSNQNILNSSHYPKQIGRDLIIIHNPLAKNTLPDNFFRFGEEWKLRFNQLEKLNHIKVCQQ